MQWLLLCHITILCLKSDMRLLFLPVVLFGAASTLAVALVALTMVSLSRQRNTHAVMMQKLFDVDGPSARDPSKTAWAKAGQVRACAR